MKKEEKSVAFLAQFLPPGSFDLVAPFFRDHTIYLTLTHERRSVLGDYRNPTRENPVHRISINANLNPYSFLITLLHELAHMFTFQHYKHSVSPHGSEWKDHFRRMLVPFLGKRVFPPDVEKALLSYLHNPAASTCTDPGLFKALYRYDDHEPGHKLVDDIPAGGYFKYDDGLVYQKLQKVRTRTRCKQIVSGKMYYFQGIADVCHLANYEQRQ